MNKIILIGNLTRDPEFSTTTSGISLCKFSLAVSRRFKNSDGEAEVDYFDIVTWRGTADICSKYLQKGNKVCITGSVNIRNYEDKDGIKRRAIDVQADEVEFLTAKNNSNDSGDYSQSASTNATKANTKKPVAQLTPVEDDGLPF